MVFGVFHFIGYYDSIANTLLKFNVRLDHLIHYQDIYLPLFINCFFINERKGFSFTISMGFQCSMVHYYHYTNCLCCGDTSNETCHRR